MMLSSVNTGLSEKNIPDSLYAGIIMVASARISHILCVTFWYEKG
jgi:hypothetical protein